MKRAYHVVMTGELGTYGRVVHIAGDLDTDVTGAAHAEVERQRTVGRYRPTLTSWRFLGTVPADAPPPVRAGEEA